MFSTIAVKSRDDFFIKSSERTPKKVFFARYVGYDDPDDMKIFVRKLYKRSQNCGNYLRFPLQNPNLEDIGKIFSYLGENYEFSKPHIKQKLNILFSGCDPSTIDVVGNAVYTVFSELSATQKNKDILKNIYVKILYWLFMHFKSTLDKINQKERPLLLAFGEEIQKHECFLLRILSLAGYDIACIVNDDKKYCEFDTKSSYSTRFAGSSRLPLQFDPAADSTAKLYENVISPTKTNTNTVRPYSTDKKNEASIYAAKLQSLLDSTKSIDNIVVTNSWMRSDFMELAQLPRSSREISGTPKIFNIFIRYIGVDNQNQYHNRLYKFRDILQKSPKNLLFLSEKIGNPSPDEVSKFPRDLPQDFESITFVLSEHINVRDDRVLTLLAKHSFLGIMHRHKSDSPIRLYNYGIRLVCWLNRYQPALYDKYDADNIPAVIYYGQISVNEVAFLSLLAGMGVDVIFISPNKSHDAEFASNPDAKRSHLYELANSSELFAYPSFEKKIAAQTIAYQASRELDTTLYQGTGLYRPRQFTRCRSVTLRTTFEEIAILWKEDAKFRPSFETTEELVTVPNIFAKIMGVPGSDTGKYWSDIKSLITDKTILFTKTPFLTESKIYTLRQQLEKIMANGKFDINSLKKHTAYPYEYLGENIQDHLLEKTQELINLKWIIGEEKFVNSTILSTVLCFDEHIIRMIQSFDYTAQIPKAIAVHVDRTMLTLTDCITLTFLNLLGFDIAIFTPTGYRNIEKFVNHEAFQLHTAGEFIFDLKVSDLSKAKGVSQEKQKRKGFRLW